MSSCLFFVACSSIFLMLLSKADGIRDMNSSGPVVDSNFGKIEGRYVDDVAIFTGIPFADNVDGKNRWRDPKFPFPWPGVWDATAVSPGCPQLCKLPSPNITCPPKQEENCLYLNIYAPKNAKMLPVVVFFHGGDFIQGYSGSLLYDGRYLVNKTNIVVVTANYRLHALGYLVYGTGDRAITGNQGLKDQILALQWVHSNIENFGGDPGRVTISGQSAGAISSSVLMTSVQPSGLFDKVIVESNPFGVPLKSMKDAIKLGKDFAKALGCGTDNDYDCLYSKNYTEVTNAATVVGSKIVDPLHLFELFLQWTPVINEIEVFGQTLVLFEKGIHPNLPILVGTTAQECILFVHEGFSSKMKKDEYDALLLALFTVDYDRVHDRYPPTNDDDNRFSAAVMSTDRTFTCPTRRAAKVYSNQTLSQHNAPLFHYVFNHSWSFEQGWKPNCGYCAKYSCHSAELPYVFGTVSLAGFKFTEDEATLSDAMMQYWGNFINYGNPNGDFVTAGRKELSGLLSWPEYMAPDGWNSMRFKTPQSEVIKDYRQSECDFWDEIGYALG